MTAPPSETIYLVTTPGLERILEGECRTLGLDVRSIEPGGVTIAGDLEAVYRCNLELRTANRVLLRLGDFHARFFDELVRQASRLPWESVVRAGGSLRLRISSRKSRLYHQDAIAERLARAIAERVGDVRVQTAAEEPEAAGDAQLVVARVNRDRVTVSADSSGELLHRRGYRLATARAPLRETLAAAMLLDAGWDGATPLVDPLAGSGTIPIEAALLARDIAPGLSRRFAFEGWPSFEPDRLAGLVRPLRDRIRDRAPGLIRGYDRDAGAVDAARANAERAGVAADVELAVAAISALPAIEGPGHIVTNPPYGARVGDRRQLRNLYARLGAVARERCAGFTVTLLVASPMHEHALGAPADERFRTTNGGIPVRALRLAAVRP